MSQHVGGSPEHSRRWITGAAAVIVSAVIPPFLVGALASQIAEDMTFDTGDLGLAMAVCYTVTCVLSPIAGRFVGWLGAHGSLRLACGMTSVGLVGIATADRAAHIMVALAFIGIPNALTQPASNEVLSRLRAPRLRALSFGLVQASIPTASLVAGTVLAIASYSASWRVAVLAVAALTVLAQLVLPRSPGERRTRVRRTGRRVVPDLRDRVGGPLLMVALFGTGCLASAAATALPTFAASTGLATGLAPWLVATAQVAGSLTSILVRVVAPVATSHATLPRRLHTVAALQLLGLLAMLGLATGTPSGFLLGSVAAFAFGWGWNGLYNLVVATARPRGIAAATGVTQAGVFLGGTAGPLSFAAIAEVYGFDQAWLAMAVLMAAAVLSALVAAHRAGLPPALPPPLQPDVPRATTISLDARPNAHLHPEEHR